MADIVIGVVGIALAWKGILDFGIVIKQLAKDDDEKRRFIALNLWCSQQKLEDWGKEWQVEDKHGRFKTLESSRQSLVLNIIAHLVEAREKVTRMLSKRYGFDIQADSRRRLKNDQLTMMGHVTHKARRSKMKVQWLTGDDALLTNLVTESNQLLDNLIQLTDMSHITFVEIFNKMSQKMESLELCLAEMRRDVSHYHQKNKQQIRKTGTQILPAAIDFSTQISYATTSLAHSSQRDAINSCIERSINSHGDRRVCEHIAKWWNDNGARILILEFPDSAEDETAISACALLYYIVPCTRLIFIFELAMGKTPLQQLYLMVQSFISSLLSLEDDATQSPATVAPFLPFPEPGGENLETLGQMISLFLGLLENAVMQYPQYPRRILIVIGGLEYSGLDDKSEICQLWRNIFIGLRACCNLSPRSCSEISAIKVFVAHGGHATPLYDCVGETDVVNFTVRDSITGDLYTDLVLSLE